MLRLDLTGLTSAVTEHGPGPAEISAISSQAAAAHQAIGKRCASGELGFLELATDPSHRDSVIALEGELPSFQKLVVMGMGGSSLGAQALIAALAPGADVQFLDNSDPDTVARVVGNNANEKTIWNAVTKSGGTSETCAQLLVVLAKLEAAMGREKALERLVVTTDPSSGSLRKLAAELGIKTLEVPTNVGGRFSVLSAVGLLPAHLAGIDTKALLAGASSMRDRVTSDSLTENPALMFAALANWHLERGRAVHVLWVYADALERIGAWFQQLWAESLGKKNAAGASKGPTPLVARGASDQHSMLQLFADGPDDKIHLFVTPATRQALPIPSESALGSAEAMDYLVGRDLGELINAQLEGTRSSLAGRGRPTALCTLESVSAFAIGELLMFLEVATAYAGTMLGVDPFDQPGVEEAKVLAFAALGRDGYADRARDPVKSEAGYVF